ncbi:hypothetical protein [Paractinoplanes toevensis]|uniref:Uncharacterized protein n=1 Tax=Paractinoplanes toevensis TaxID=571911 RepID=A0A919W957_9ACTN|nr:hypothetical protein [Actinoplanes toevensis]GIM95916.1 hypothetical protein Ato02nite_077090 [Actinoplanes toevensis]
MGLFAHGRPIALAVALAGLLCGAAACEDGGAVALPSTLPSIERATGRATTEATTSSTPRVSRSTGTAPAAAPEPTTREAAGDPDPTTEGTTKAAEPIRTTAPETTKAAEPTRTTAPETTEAEAPPIAPTPSANPSEVAATSADTGIGTLGWLLVLLVVGLAALLGVVLVNRSRRTAEWESEAVRLAAGTRAVTATRLPPVLAARTAQQRSLAWTPVRADLTELDGRWALLAGGTGDEYRRMSAGQISTMLQDLVAAVDTENQALATGQDPRPWADRIQQIDEALDSALAAFVAQPEPDPGPDPYPA